MHQIKFRAWDKKKKEWSGGWGGRELWDFPPEWSKEPSRFVFVQFTGLKDKNGKEIYEGDILRYTKTYNVLLKGSRPVSKIEYHYWEVFFSERGQWCMRKGDTSSSVAGQNDRHEIIGNIFENLELISKEK
jgi:uncharacterized phage protein (TIGR01671 family)